MRRGCPRRLPCLLRGRRRSWSSARAGAARLGWQEDRVPVPMSAFGDLLGGDLVDAVLREELAGCGGDAVQLVLLDPLAPSDPAVGRGQDAYPSRNRIRLCSVPIIVRLCGLGCAPAHLPRLAAPRGADPTPQEKEREHALTQWSRRPRHGSQRWHRNPLRPASARPWREQGLRHSAPPPHLGRRAHRAPQP